MLWRCVVRSLDSCTSSAVLAQEMRLGRREQRQAAQGGRQMCMPTTALPASKKGEQKPRLSWKLIDASSSTSRVSPASSPPRGQG